MNGWFDSSLARNAWVVGRSPLAWAIVAGALCLLLLLPGGLGARVDKKQRRALRMLGMLLGFASAGFWVAALPGLGDPISQVVFWLLAAITIGSAAAMITMRDAVYAAIWFALSLLGTAGLLLFQGSQFLGAATIVVYAGAIVVTFLFVVMLASPEGHASYDRLSWSWFSSPQASLDAKPIAVIASAVLVALLSFTVAWDSNPQPAVTRTTPAGHASSLRGPGDVASRDHVARFGEVLFSSHLIAVEAVGTLLLVALVGAVASLLPASVPAVSAGSASASREGPARE